MFKKHVKRFLPKLTQNIHVTTQHGTWIGLGLVMVLAIYGQWSVRRNRYWVSHTFDVLEEIYRVESGLFDAFEAICKSTVASIVGMSRKILKYDVHLIVYGYLSESTGGHTITWLAKSLMQQFYLSHSFSLGLPLAF